MYIGTLVLHGRPDDSDRRRIRSMMRENSTTAMVLVAPMSTDEIKDARSSLGSANIVVEYNITALYPQNHCVNFRNEPTSSARENSGENSFPSDTSLPLYRDIVALDDTVSLSTCLMLSTSVCTRGVSPKIFFSIVVHCYM